MWNNVIVDNVIAHSMYYVDIYVEMWIEANGETVPRDNVIFIEPINKVAIKER